MVVELVTCFLRLGTMPIGPIRPSVIFSGGSKMLFAKINPFVRSAYNYDMDEASDASGLHCADPSLAVQSAAEEVDINTIVRRFGLTGQLPEDVRAPTYGDFTGIGNYHQAMNAIALANESFEEMPADVRARFGNDPSAFVDFCSDEKNRDEMEKLGLLVPAREAVAAVSEVLGTQVASEVKTPPA
ncbi:MAG: internal scaffolding protein [Microviridae sp.]|nr:MAG: internal scaffolding protein [Microviridae sp.]